LSSRKGPVTAILTLTYNVTIIDDDAHEWINAKEHNLTSLAKILGLDENHPIRAKITLELSEEPCTVCSQPTTGDKICANCSKPVCDEHAKTDTTGTRYCPICYLAHGKEETKEQTNTL